MFSITGSGAVDTIHLFHDEDGTDGYDPLTPFLLAPDGQTLQGTTQFGGANGNGSGGGIIFSMRGSRFAILHAFDDTESGTPGTAYNPAGLIFGTDGQLYGVTRAGGSGGTLFSMATDGSGFAVHYVFNGNTTVFGGAEPAAALVPASNGLMYGATLSGAVQGNDGNDGALFSYNPASGKLKAVANSTTNTGAQSLGALIEAASGYLCGTTSLYGSSGRDCGSIFRVAPALKTFFGLLPTENCLPRRSSGCLQGWAMRSPGGAAGSDGSSVNSRLRSASNRLNTASTP